MRLGLLPRDPPRAPGDGESVWVACGAGTRVHAAKPSAGHAHGRAERSGRALMEVDRNITEGKKENRD
jgi:hypothetical protein